MKAELTAEDLLAELKQGKYRPVYYLMGDEPYYIDLIADYIEENVLDETAKAFNQTVVYGTDIDAANLVNAARRYPLMAEHQVIIVKEAQNIRGMDALSYYLQQPLQSTILVICHKNGTIDKRRKLAADIEKAGGVVYTSRKLRENALPLFITSYVRNQKQADIDPKATAMLADYVGNDLSRLTGEIDKLTITLPEGNRLITPEQIEQNIGISKEYNNFELRTALVNRDVLRAHRIARYFKDNPKSNPIQVTLTVLFNYFSSLMLAHYAPNRSEEGIAAFLDLKSPWQAREYISGMRAFSARRVMEIIAYIRETDARSKGVGNASTDDGDLLRELVERILH